MEFRRLTSNGRRSLLVAVFMISAFTSIAQFRISPAPFATANQEPRQRTHAVARPAAVDPLSIPFWDDFSHPFQGAYPDTVLWEPNYTVWVNSGMAIKPLTLNVATFDGLDSAGLPYNATDVFERGYTDTLTSRAIDLSETADNPVLQAERSTVFLSFFYQWKGHGEAPDMDEDYLELEFLDDSDNWTSVLRIEPHVEILADTFYAANVAVTGDQFFHENFRFRLRSYGRQSGPFDTWNVDYVYLNKGRNENDLSFPDRAISTGLSPLFGRYRAMPRRHLRSDEQIAEPEFEIQNMKNALATLNFRTEASFFHTNTSTGETSSFETVLKDSTAINITNGILLPREHKTIRLDTVPTTSSTAHFPADMDCTFIQLTITLKTGDNVPVNPGGPGDYTPNYEPILFTANDTIRASYVLSRYYAYDDAVAEFSVELQETGDMASLAFDVDFDDSFSQDTLIAFDVYFPPHGVSANQQIDFTIYHDDGSGKPGETWLRVPARRVQGKLGAFQRFAFIPAILIDEPRFHIGWTAPVEGRAQVGLDMSNDTGDLIYVNTDGTWEQNKVVVGSLMIRPVFGSGEVGENVSIEEPPALSVYPNPSTGRIIIGGLVDDLRIFSITGRAVHYQIETTDSMTTIELREAPGLYLLRYRQGHYLRTEKIVIVGQ